MNCSRCVPLSRNLTGTNSSSGSCTSGALVFETPAQAAVVGHASFSSDGRHFVTATGGYRQPGESRVWHARTGEPLSPPLAHGEGVLMSELTDSVRGQTRTFTLVAADENSADEAAGFAFQIDWGDGTPVQTIQRTAANGSGTTIDHRYGASGSFSVGVTAIDQNGGASELVTHSVAVATVALQLDPGDPSNTLTALVVGGTLANDNIVINPAGAAGSLTVLINGASRGEFNPTGRIIVFGQAGDDSIQVLDAIRLPAELHGDAGNDRIKGGGGEDILLGGEGDDLLVGGSGRDLLIGGYGSDRLVGDSEDDILIAGSTAYDANDAALRAIMKEWTRSDADYSTRVNHLQGAGGGLNGPFSLIADPTASSPRTVFDDGVMDILSGSAGQDWFLFNADGDGGAKDKVTDLSAQEFASDIDFITGP